jgi:phosphate-selective porin OprO/OprP
MKRVLIKHLFISVFLAMALVLVYGTVAVQAGTTEEIQQEIQILKKKLEENKALEERVKILEQKLEEVQKVTGKVQEQEKIIKEKKASPAFSFWKNDFYLETPDGNFSMRIRGNVHFDVKMYGGNSKTPTQFDIRRARIDFQGLFWKYIQFRVQPELADSPYIRNAWVDYKFRDWLHLRAGQMKPPFSTSWWTLDNNVNFLERGSSTPVYPYFDRGVWLWGDVLNNTLTWNASMWTGAGLDLDYPKGDIDDHKDIVARLFFSPFKNNKGHVLEGLHLCLEGTYSNQSIPTSRFETKGMSTQIRDDKMWKWKTESTTTTAEIGQRNRWGAELHYIKGPISFSTEYLVTEYKDIDVFNKAKTTKGLSEDGRITSWSTFVSYFLTGESNTVSNFGWRKPNPKVDFDPVKLKGSGAWEILARYTHTDVSDNLFASNTIGTSTYTILEGAPWTDEYTAGVSWTWNPLVRWQLNYTHVTAGGNGLFSGDTTYLAGEGKSQNEDMVGMRMIFKF